MAAYQCELSSAIVAESEDRSFVFKVRGYSRAKQLLKCGECVTSPPFTVQGHDWVLRYYPNGRLATGAAAGYMSLVLDTADGKDVTVKARNISVLDKNGLPGRYYGTMFENIMFETPVSFTSRNSYLCLMVRKAGLEHSGDIIEDSFNIRCDLTLKDIGEQFVVVPPSDMHLHFGSLLESMDGADVAFLIGGERFSAHRLVLAARSSVFRAELLGAMKEKTDSLIEISDMEPHVFRSLLHFIYTDSLPDLEIEMASDQGEGHGGGVVMASHLLVAADRYDIERLKLICEHKLCSHIDTNMVATSLALAEQHRCHGLKVACLRFLASPSNLEAMMASDGYQHLKRSCPSALKDLIASLLPVTMKAAKDIIMEI